MSISESPGTLVGTRAPLDHSGEDWSGTDDCDTKNIKSMLEKTSAPSGKASVLFIEATESVSTQGQVGWSLGGWATWAVMFRFCHGLNVSPKFIC